MRNLHRLHLRAFVALVAGFSCLSLRAQQPEPEILPAPPGEESPSVQPEPPLVREEITLYGAQPLGRKLPMHLRAAFESHARGEARRLAAFDNQRYILNHVAWMNGLPSPFVGPQGEPSLDYIYSGLGGKGFAPGGHVFEPWPYVAGDIWGYPFHDTIESPVGHRITWRGPNAYTYEPVYAHELEKPVEPSVEWPADEQAMDQLEPALPPDVTDSALESAMAAIAKQDFAAALELLDRVGDGSPDFSPAMLLRVQVLCALERFAEAALALRDVIRSVPQESWNIAQNNHVLAVGESTRALRALEAAVAADRGNADLRLLLGWQYALLGHADAAMHQCDQALEINGDDDEAKAIRAWSEQNER